MTTILLTMRSVNHELPTLLKELHEHLAQQMMAYAEQWLNIGLRKQVDAGLGRGWYARRKKARGRGRFKCQACGSRWRGRFSRNGYRQRWLDLAVGQLQVELPRVKCSCGGSVSLHLEGLRPRQRLGDDLQALVGHWAGLAYSLREMKQEIDAALTTSVGLRSLNERFHAIAAQVPVWHTRGLQDVPPVVMMDAVWLTRMEETGEIQRDRAGRTPCQETGEKTGDDCTRHLARRGPQGGAGLGSRRWTRRGQSELATAIESLGRTGPASSLWLAALHHGWQFGPDCGTARSVLGCAPAALYLPQDTQCSGQALRS
jgi:hypothetical protein